MKCKRCLKEIEETENYCEECKKAENQFNQLVEENIELNKLEITKEVEELHQLNDDNFELVEIKDELKDIVKIDDEEEKNNIKKIIIIIASIFSVVVSILVCLLFFKNDSKEVEEEKINYKKVLNEYGKFLEGYILDYITENDVVPTWDILIQSIDYSNYKIVCNVHEIYEDGSIYLNECEIDNDDIKYSFGIWKQPKGKEINIYKNTDQNNFFIYTEEESDTLAGSLICKTDSCEFISAYEEYALIKENDAHYLYNYLNNDIVFGPFNLIDEEKNILAYENILYGILYNENNKQNIYSIKTDKSSDNIDGNLLIEGYSFNPKLMYKYGYAMFETNKGTSFISLNTGKVSYTISDGIYNFMESNDNKIVYITTLNSSNSKKIIYNSNGKKLFNGKEYNDFKIYNDEIIIYDDNKFYKYDLNLKLSLTSKNYDKILNLYEDIFVVINDGYLELVDINDNILVNFDFEWDVNYSFDSDFSNFKKIDQGFEVTIMVKDTIEDINYNLIYNSPTKNIKIIKN